MPAYRCRQHLSPARRCGLAIFPDGRGIRVGAWRAPDFRKSKMTRLFAVVCLFLSTSCAVAATRPSQSKAASLEQLHSRTALIGQEVEVVSCAGIPLSDAPNQENLIIIYPCGAELPDEISKKAVAGRLSAQTVLKPSKEWAMGDSPAFKGRFRGILKREAIDPGDEEQVLVIELDEVEFYSAVEL